MILLAYAIFLSPSSSASSGNQPATGGPTSTFTVASINKRQSTQSPTFDDNYLANLIDTAHRNNVLVRIRIFN